MNPIPIQTRYMGWKFRSRLEARWAVFFDSLGIRWDYEPEGFDLGEGILYLPDFRLKGFWAEVKPDEFLDCEQEKATRLVAQTGIPLLKLIGPPDYVKYEVVTLETHSGDSAVLEDEIIFPSTGNRERFWWAPADSDVDALRECDRYIGAVGDARSARFERGDPPRPRRQHNPITGTRYA